MDSKKLAKQIRKDALEMAYLSKSSHIASAFSIADIIAVLYADILKYDSKNPTSETRDRFILSKGHACSAVYSALARCGFFKPETLKTHYANGSMLSGHVSNKVPGVEISTGSLGHGPGIGSGIALALKLNKKTNHVYVLIGDGECDEGSIWEMALFASQNKLNNLTIIIDKNGFQALGKCDEVLKNEHLKEKFNLFGFDTYEIDGHSHEQLKEALSKTSIDKPICIVANTIKGKGVSFMENNLLWHYRNPDEEQYKLALKELEGD